MSLPLPWVDRIFEKLTLLYGQQFLARWRDLDLDAVKHDWAHELDGLQNAPQAIAYALQNLDADKPPTVLQFRALCQRAPAAVLPSLPTPDADPARAAAELAKLRELCPPREAASSVDHKAWAKRIIARYENGQKIGAYALRCAHEALGLPQPGRKSVHFSPPNSDLDPVAAPAAQPQDLTPAEAYYAAEQAARSASAAMASA